MPAKRSVPSATATRQRKKPQPSAPCELCGKILGRASDMKRHMNIHGPKTFFCGKSDCDFASHTATGLKAHRGRHTEIRLKCPECEDFNYSGDPSALHRHRVRKHHYVPRKVISKAQAPKQYVPTCVPASVCGAISAQNNQEQGRHSQSTSFPSGSTLSQVPAFSYGASSSLKFTLPSLLVMDQENAARAVREGQYTMGTRTSPQYLNPALLDELERTSRLRLHPSRCEMK